MIIKMNDDYADGDGYQEPFRGNGRKVASDKVTIDSYLLQPFFEFAK